MYIILTTNHLHLNIYLVHTVPIYNSPTHSNLPLPRIAFTPTTCPLTTPIYSHFAYPHLHHLYTFPTYHLHLHRLYPHYLLPTSPSTPLPTSLHLPPSSLPSTTFPLPHLPPYLLPPPIHHLIIYLPPSQLLNSLSSMRRAHLLSGQELLCFIINSFNSKLIKPMRVQDFTYLIIKTSSPKPNVLCVKFQLILSLVFKLKAYISIRV